MAPHSRVAILISGRGSNMSALIKAAQQPDFPAHPALVISNVAGAAGLERAAALGVATATVSHRAYTSRELFDRALHDTLEREAIDFVCLAGFMRLLSPWFCDTWAGRIINIHPALLPAFKGLDTHERALAAGVTIHGCTVHHVTSGMDEGPIIGQAAVSVRPDDTAASLGARVLAAEHQLYPLALHKALTGRAPPLAAPSMSDGVLVSL
jgi:phosphoribosylglycinamide formyltransferase-1